MSEQVVLCRCWANGRTSMVLTVDKQIREYLALKEMDVLAFRMVVIEGKRMILGQKVPLTQLAKLATAVPGNSTPQKEGDK